jgi:hypothetical protein
MTTKERPILFSGPMVRAILAGRKTQTRRVVKLPNTMPFGEWKPTTLGGHGNVAPFPAMSNERTGRSVACPYGEPGDRLWVRETWTARVAHSHGMDACDCDDVLFTYPADGAERFVSGSEIAKHDSADSWVFPRSVLAGGNAPSIHMPRWACRIVLEVVSVRVERVQGISRADAKAEGFLPSKHSGLESWNGQMYGNAELAFAACWRDINGVESWDANPWVWVVEFRRVE